MPYVRPWFDAINSSTQSNSAPIERVCLNALVHNVQETVSVIANYITLRNSCEGRGTG